MKKHLILVLLAVALLLTACGGKSKSDVPEITDSDQPIEVKAGDEFTITLDSSPNTGLHWEVAEEFDTTVVEYVWKEFIPKTDNPQSSGWDVWTFKAVAPGTATITLGYYRGLTEDTARVEVFTIIVK